MPAWLSNFSRPPPPSGSAPRYFVSTQRNLRPVVLFCASISALWALASAVSYFRSISVADHDGFHSLGTFLIVMGALAIGVFVCECFGILAAITQRLSLIRLYAYISGLASLITIAAGLIQVIIHFSKKGDIISVCTTSVTGDDVYYYPFGFWGPISHSTLDSADAQSWCTDEWNHDSWADIVGLLILIVLSGVFTIIAFSYYRQTLDPSAARVPRPAGGAAQHYNPSYGGQPYNASVPTLGYNYNEGFAGPYKPPAGPPPGFSTDDSKPPGYSGDNTRGYSLDKKDDEDPFADFESGSHHETH